MHWIFKDISFIHLFQCVHFSFLYITVPVFRKDNIFYFLKNNDYLYIHFFAFCIFTSFSIFFIYILIFPCFVIYYYIIIIYYCFSLILKFLFSLFIVYLFSQMRSKGSLFTLGVWVKYIYIYDIWL